MKLFADLAYLSVGKAKAFLQSRTAIMLSDSILIALLRIFNPNTSQVPLLKDTILDLLLSVVSANTLQAVIQVLPNTYHSILKQNKAISFAFIKAFFISEKLFITKMGNHGQISRDLFLLREGRCCFFDERLQKLFNSILILREMLF